MTDKNDKKKYRHTKQLVRIAIEQGYTNKEIAKSARLSEKSIGHVSKWRNGKVLANEHQMQNLLKEFGHLLKRKMEHLFYTLEEKDSSLNQKFFKLNGELTLKHTLYFKKQTSNRMFKVALLRLVLLKEGDHYHLITQHRAGYDKDHYFELRDVNSLVHSSNEDANWLCINISTMLSANEILELCDKFVIELKSLKQRFFVNDEKTLPFIIRQILLKQGYCASDVIDLSEKREIINEPNKPEES